MKIFIKNIKSLLMTIPNDIPFVEGNSMSELHQLNDAWLAIEDGLIADYGSMSEFEGIEDWRNLTIIDASGRFVLPTWCDSHTHTVFAKSRAGEFEDRLRGLTYEEIAQRGGGILNSARNLQAMSEDDLYTQAFDRLNFMMQHGTGAVEIKSGYGLTAESELKMLRVIKRLKETHPITIQSTFLALHAIPEHYSGNVDAFVDHMIQDVLPIVASEKLADFVDVFCEKGYFSVDHMSQLLKAAGDFGIQGKVHVNQFNNLGAVQEAVQLGVRSVDHLELISNDDLVSLKNSKTMAVALPGCSLFLEIPYTEARRIMEENISLALATDFNPGSAPNSNMNLVNSLACIKMKMLPHEVIQASTINAAYAMDVHQTLGSISRGKKANLILTKPLDSISEMFYYFGQSPVDGVVLNGKVERSID